MSNPSLLCVPYRFKTSKLYSQIPDSGLGDFVVTRSASNSATRVNASGLIETVLDNVPRLDYPLGGITAGCPALLVEPLAQNLFPRSQEFDNASWSKDRLNTTGTPPWVNVEVAPDGTTTAEKFIQASGTVLQGYAQEDVSVTGGITYVISVFAKQGTRHIPQIRTNIDGTNKGAFFNTSNGTVGTVDAGLSASIENYGNGWYRCSVRVTASTNAGRYCLFGNSQTNGTLAVSDDGGFQFFWGAQLEVGSVATSYIPTAASPVTRGADVVEKTGVSSLIGQTEGTLYIECENVSALNDVFYLNKDSTNTVRITKDASNIFTGIIRASGVSTPFVGSSGVTGIVKIAIAYKSGDSAMYLNGTQVGTTSSDAITFSAALSKVTLSDSPFFVGKSPTRIRDVAIYPTRLPDTGPLSLQSLTQ